MLLLLQCLLMLANAHRSQGGSTDRYTYDIRGNLNAEFQSIGTEMPPDTRDVTGDGVISPEDQLLFLSWYFASTPDMRADFDRNGVVNQADLDTFTAAYTGGLSNYPPNFTYTGYIWAYQNSSAPGAVPTGFNRLSLMSYPIRGNVPMGKRALALSYGNNGTDMDSLLCRVTSIDNSAGDTGLSLGKWNIARFGYTGVSRRNSMTLGFGTTAGVITQNLGGSTNVASVTKLDSFGRLLDLDYRNALANTDPASLLCRGQYTYDVQGNRLPAVVSQASSSNTRSQLNAYDSLDRLIDTQVGAITFNAGVPSISGVSQRDQWRLDLLGNWVGGAASHRHFLANAGRNDEIDHNRQKPKTPSERREVCVILRVNLQSGRRDLNSRHSAWKADALPLSYARGRCLR